MPEAALVEDGEPDEVVHALGADALSIGRSEDNTIVIADHAVSKAHAVVARIGDRFVIQDLDSRNGTKVNGRAIQARVLVDGDVIKIGPRRFRFEAGPAGVDGPHTTMPAAGTDGAAETPPSPPPVPVPTPSPGLAQAPGPAPAPHAAPSPPLSGAVASGAAQRPHASGAVPTRRVAGLAELGRTLAEAPDDLTVLSQVAGILVGLLDASAAAIVLLDPTSGKPSIMARRLAAEALEGVSPLDDSIGSLGAPVGLDRALIEAALAADEVVAVAGGPDPGGAPGVVEHLVVALRERGRRHGFVALDRRPGAPAFDPGDRALLAVAATQLTAFLRSAR